MSDILPLKVYVLLSPFLLLLTLYATVKAGDWMERREQRRHAAE
jgi:hypothetical protein